MHPSQRLLSSCLSDFPDLPDFPGLPDFPDCPECPARPGREPVEKISPRVERALQLFADLDQMASDEIARLAEIAIRHQRENEHHIIVDFAEDQLEAREVDHDF